jgi:tripartite-type tricarboxylate transporter receptor subunit TctC
VLVPYNGSAEVAQGVLTRSVDFSLDGPSASLSLIQGGQFRVLAKFDPRPFPPVPDVPIITSEVPKLDEITVWLGLVAPKGTPAAVVNRLNAEVSKITGNAEVRRYWATQGTAAMTMGVEEFGRYLNEDIAKWEKIVKLSGAKVD